VIRIWRAWVALWDRREPATALALVRISVALVLLYDLVAIWRLDVVTALYAAPPDGYAWASGGWATRLFGTGPDAAFTLWLVATIAAACVALGLATRAACVVFVLVGAQLAYLAPDSDRGIDMLLRVIIAILALSRSHAQWSLDAWLWRRLGRPMSREVPAWPRYLIAVQLIWVYFSGGMNKSGAEWGPLGGFMALANALTDPHMARFDPSWVGHVIPLTQIATALTMGFELGAPLYLLFLYYAETADRPGRLRRFVNRYRLRWIWLGLGVSFHLGIALGLVLGIFPWGMLALYPALLLSRDLRKRDGV
jgi:hypothetical protein